MSYLKPFSSKLDKKDLERLDRNPLRILDSKNSETQNILKEAPKISDHLPQESLDLLDLIRDTFSNDCNIEIDHKLVRGLDYYASSLHKWLSTPLGAGILYVNKKNTSKIWPFFASGSQNLNDIKRLNHTGTHPVHTDIAISNAIDYINWIGVKKKEDRLRFLQRYWSDKLRGKKNVLVNTPQDIQRSCGIGNVGLKNIKPGKMAQLLFDEYNIFTVAIDGANVHGCRISPNVFTTTEELDSLVNAVTELSQINS